MTFAKLKLSTNWIERSGSIVMSGKKISTEGVATAYPRGLLNAALVLAALAGILHVYIGVQVFGLPSGLALVLIALVYFGGIGLIAANYKRDLWIKIAPGWVVLVLVLWALAAGFNVTGTRDPLAFVDKAVEVILLGTLVRIRMVRSRPMTVS